MTASPGRLQIAHFQAGPGLGRIGIAPCPGLPFLRPMAGMPRHYGSALGAIISGRKPITTSFMPPSGVKVSMMMPFVVAVRMDSSFYTMPLLGKRL